MSADRTAHGGMETHMNRSITITCALAAALSAACVGPGQGPARTKADERAAEVRRYCDELLSDGRIDPVRPKIQLPISFDAAQDVERMSDRTYPTDAERAAVKALWEARTECRRFGESRLGPLPSYRAESEDALVDLFGDLHEGAVTYGQFARKLLYIGARDKHARELLDEARRARDSARVD